VDELSLLGNAAAIPIIIAITQFLKKNFSFKYKSDAVAFFVAILVCFGWRFAYGSVAELEAIFSQHWILVTKAVGKELIVSVATWMSASKSYDLFHGNKKRTLKQEAEKEVLKEEIVTLKKNGNGAVDEKIVEIPGVSARLREILEEEN